MRRSPRSRRVRALSRVPPLKPPFAEKAARTSRTGSPQWVRTQSTSIHTPRSLGTLSKPQKGTMRAPLATAASWCWSIIRRTQGVSPVMST